MATVKTPYSAPMLVLSPTSYGGPGYTKDYCENNLWLPYWARETTVAQVHVGDNTNMGGDCKNPIFCADFGVVTNILRRAWISEALLQ